LNLAKLFEMQRQLDAHIEKEHPRKPGEDRLAKKILALMVELGELANEARFFKYWSHDQAPRTKIEYICPTCNGTGDENYDSYIDDLEGGYTHEVINCEDCGGTGTLGYKNPLLEEFADCLHFLLSIGLESEIGTFTGDELMPIKMGTIEIQFITLFKATVTFLEDINYYPDMWELFLGLGEMLGFTWEQIEEEYCKKNQINHERQENGY